MVSANPIFQGGFTLKRLEATVITNIWPALLFFTLVAAVVSVISSQTSHDLSVSNQLLTVLGTVLGLVISFRTSSAYERYQDGRKMWTNITTASRNLAQQIWIHIPVDRPAKGNAVKTTVLQNIIEKKSMINLILAFSISIKHFLRDERGLYYADLYPLISFLPKYANGNPHEHEKLPLWHDDKDLDRPVDKPVTEMEREQTPDSCEKITASIRSRNGGYDPESAFPQVDSERDLEPARNPPNRSIYNALPLLRFPRWVFHKMFPTSHTSKRRKRKTNSYFDYVESDVPLEIILVLSNYIAWCLRNGLIPPAVATGIIVNLTSLQDNLSNLERVCNTPLPFAYQVHLRMSLWLYLCLLPFQINKAFGFLTIPATAFASFLLLGFLEIGHEIENPFNYDLNDLDLDYFCHSIQRELHLITAHTNPNPSDFLFTSLNQPFAPSDLRSALELTQSDAAYHLPNDPDVAPGMPSIRRTLVKGWKDVDTYTRK